MVALSEEMDSFSLTCGDLTRATPIKRRKAAALLFSLHT
jgi:hypothetical protein